MRRFFISILLVIALALLILPKRGDAIFLGEWKGCGGCKCTNPFGIDFCSIVVLTTGCYAHCQCGIAQWTCHKDCNLCEGKECSYPCESGTLAACNDGLCEFNCGASWECDEVANAPGVIVPGGVCNNCIFTPCTCGAWANAGCGAGGCAANQMYQTRSCNPPGCAAESRCVNDSCGAWANDACGAGGCTPSQMHQTRSCTYHCLPESRCLNDSCTPWVNDACGAGGCAPSQMRQTRSCTYDCLPESQCVNDICTPWVNDACGPAGGCVPGEMHQTRNCTYDCLPESRCVLDVACCTCGAWANDACGAGGCAPSQMRQTRSCNPPGCAAESQCLNDICTPWSNDACGVAGCAPLEMHQTRNCTYDCLPESQCVLDLPACCTCTPWANDACGAGGCAPTQMRQTRSCVLDCDVESQCVADTCTPWIPDACGVAGCGPIQMHQTRSCTFGCESETRCVDDPKCGVVFINPLEAGSIPEVIAAIADWIFIIGLALVILMDIIAGIVFITAGGEPDRITTAKRIFFWKAIGAAVIIVSKGISGIIRYIIG